MRNQGPSLTPSLANYFRADLIAHVTNWPADVLEKQVRVTQLKCIIADLTLTIFRFDSISGADCVGRS